MAPSRTQLPTTPLTRNIRSHGSNVLFVLEAQQTTNCTVAIRQQRETLYRATRLICFEMERFEPWNRSFVRTRSITHYGSAGGRTLAGTRLKKRDAGGHQLAGIQNIRSVIERTTRPAVFPSRLRYRETRNGDVLRTHGNTMQKRNEEVERTFFTHQSRVRPGRQVFIR